MKKQRKHCTPEEKVAILRRHLLEKEPISDLCDELGLQPTVFYRWQKEFFENGAAAFEQKRPSVTPGTRSWISSYVGPRRPRSALGGSSNGSTSLPVSSTTGANVTAR